jgi:arabinose-5-phosphate isomerase
VLRAADIMTSHPVTVPRASLAYDALQLMENRPSPINVVPVVDELGHCLGLVRLHDLVQAGI